MSWSGRGKNSWKCLELEMMIFVKMERIVPIKEIVSVKRQKEKEI